MNLRFETERFFSQPSNNIKVEYTKDTFKLSVDISKQWLRKDRRNDTLSDYFSTWTVTFDELLNDPNFCGDDSWIFPYRLKSVNTLEPNPYLYYKSFIDADLVNVPHVACLSIRPHTKSFLDAFLLIKSAPKARVVVNKKIYRMAERTKPQTLGIVKSLMQVDPIGDLTYRVTYNNIARDFDMFFRPSTGRCVPEVVRTVNGVAEFKYIPPRQWSAITVDITSPYKTLTKFNIVKE